MGSPRLSSSGTMPGAVGEGKDPCGGEIIFFVYF